MEILTSNIVETEYFSYGLSITLEKGIIKGDYIINKLIL